MRRIIFLMLGFTLVLVPLAWLPAQASSSFADSAFQIQWQAGEGITPNFWGPLALSHDGQQEPYKEMSGGTRLVQYFDKGRMEAGASSIVTSGLLATELITGKVQMGDSTYESRTAAKIAVAGDPTNSGPTYADIDP